MKNLLDCLVERNRKFTEMGKVASYIPELKKANPNLLGISIVTSNGESFFSGDYEAKFTIQSVSKPIVLLLALMDNGEDKVFEKVGKEPTGDPFNSIIRLETFNELKPLNPMINAGAIAVTSLVKGSNGEEKFEKILNMFRSLANNPNIKINNEVYMSEKSTGNRNRSMAYFLKDIGILDGDVEDVLDLYFKQCSIEVNSKDIANIGAVLANQGRDIYTGEELVPVRYSKIAKTTMVTCGMYDESGEFAINVGIPGKSGVGGGIMCAVPNKMGIGVFGPALDKKGNSKAGLKLLEELSKELNLNIF